MKRVWPAWLLMFLGAFLVSVALVATFWAPDAAQRTPLDSYARTYLTGEADKLDPVAGEVEHFPVRITSITQIDPEKSDDDVVVFVTSTCVNVDVDDPPDCLTDDDERMITVSQANFASDRRTAMAVNDPKYVVTEVPVEGLTNKWPFDNGPKTYPVWDDLTQEATPAEFVGKAEIEGLTVNQYEQVITDAPIDLGNGIAGLYSLDVTYSIDPRTGKIINQEMHDVRTLADGGSTALDLTAAFTDDTISENVQTAKDATAQLNLLLTTLPLIGYVVGGILLLLGVFLLLRARRTTSDESTDSTTSPEPEPAQTKDRDTA